MLLGRGGQAGFVEVPERRGVWARMNILGALCMLLLLGDVFFSVPRVNAAQTSPVYSLSGLSYLKRME